MLVELSASERRLIREAMDYTLREVTNNLSNHSVMGDDEIALAEKGLAAIQRDYAAIVAKLPARAPRSRKPTGK